MRENRRDTALPRSTRYSLILQFQPHATTTHTMRAVDYITNGFGIDPRVMPVPTPNAPQFTDFGYLGSPSGGIRSGSRVLSLQERFGDAVSRMAAFGLNPRFLDIVRGPGGRGYLVQTIRLVNAYRANLRRYNNINDAYNNSVRIAGGESLLMPRSFLTNDGLISYTLDGSFSRWLSTVLSAL